jgi:hypothetical protein
MISGATTRGLLCERRFDLQFYRSSPRAGFHWSLTFEDWCEAGRSGVFSLPFCPRTTATWGPPSPFPVAQTLSLRLPSGNLQRGGEATGATLTITVLYTDPVGSTELATSLAPDTTVVARRRHSAASLSRSDHLSRARTRLAGG